MEEIPYIDGLNDKILLQKFVQIYIEGTPYMSFFQTSDFHGEGFRKFLNKLNIPFRGRKIPNKIDVDGRYELVGVGKVKNIMGKHFVGGNSLDYSEGVNKKHLEEISKLTDIEFKIKTDLF